MSTNYDWQINFSGKYCEQYNKFSQFFWEMGLSTSLANNNKKLHKYENVTNIIKKEHIFFQGIDSMGLCTPWVASFIHNWKIIKT